MQPFVVGKSFELVVDRPEDAVEDHVVEPQLQQVDQHLRQHFRKLAEHPSYKLDKSAVSGTRI